MESRNYEVAGHVFGIKLNESCPFWEKLGNYAPFQCDKEPDFSLEMVNALDIPENKKTVYVGEVVPEEPKLNLYIKDDHYLVEMAPFGDMGAVAWMRMDMEYNHGELFVYDVRKFGRFAIDNSLMLMFAFHTACMDTLEMHASVIMHEGKGYLFIAKSGTGKSTQSRMWIENIKGAELLNDDNPIVRIMEDGCVRVFGSPWSGKTPCYRNLNVPVGGIVRIRRCSENKITRLNLIESYASMTSSCSGFRPVEKMADGLHKTISGVISNVPCYVLDCRPDAEAAMVCHDGVCRK